MKQILIASNNKGKIREYNYLLNKYGIEGISTYDYFGKEIDVVEDGTTYFENAFKKASEISNLSSDITIIADDSGFEVEAMHGEPGLYTSRFMKGIEREVINQAIIDNCKASNNFNCRYVTTLVLMYPDKTYSVFEGIVNGKVVTKPIGTNGFAFDPIFFYEPLRKTFAEISTEEKNRYSARGVAFKQLEVYLDMMK